MVWVACAAKPEASFRGQFQSGLRLRVHRAKKVLRMAVTIRARINRALSFVTG